MKKAASGAWRVALVLVGTVIGAGFASGAEIMAYFTGYGEAGLAGMLAAGLLFWAGTYSTLQIAQEHKSTDYGTFTEIVAGKWIGSLLDAAVTLFMLLGYGVMLAGSGAIFMQQWNLPGWMGAGAMAVCTLLALQGGRRGILLVNQILTPILIIGILLLGGYGLAGAASKTETAGLLLQPLSVFTALPVEKLPQALGSGALYASYNMLGASAVLVELAGEVRGRREALRAGAAGAVILLILMLSLGVATFSNYDTIKGVSIPALAILEDAAFWQRLYVFVLLGAMYTTAVSDGFGFVSRVGAATSVPRGVLCLIMTLLALVLSGLGFTELVSKGYRIFGYLGIGQLLLMIIRCIPKKENIYEEQKRRQGRPEKHLARNRRR